MNEEERKEAQVRAGTFVRNWIIKVIYDTVMGLDDGKYKYGLLVGLGIIFRKDDGTPLSRQRIFQIIGGKNDKA